MITRIFREICVPREVGGLGTDMLTFHYVPGGAMLGNGPGLLLNSRGTLSTSRRKLFHR